MANLRGCLPQHLPRQLLPGSAAGEGPEARAATCAGVVRDVGVVLQLILSPDKAVKVLVVRGETVLAGDCVRLEQRAPGRFARVQARLCALGVLRYRSESSGHFPVGGGSHGGGQLSVAVGNLGAELRLRPGSLD